MAQKAPARIGDDESEIDTPALVIDLDAFERNMKTMADLARAKNVRLRPHAKMHKTPAIAKLQVEAGAVGVCCQKLSEAEAMVEGGVLDVFLSNQVIGRRKIERVVELAKHAKKIALAVDQEANVRELSAAAAAQGVTLDVLVELEVGMMRCGVAAGEPAANLAKRIASLPGLQFQGLHAYHGRAQHMRELSERGEAIAHACAEVKRTLAALGGDLPCPIITGGGTGTFPFELASGVYNEIQPGSYLFMDRDYADNKDMHAFEQALFCVTTVISRTENRVVVDAGLKATSIDSGLPVIGPHFLYITASDEHGIVVCEKEVPNVGTHLRLIPGHCDPTVNLHDYLVGVRKGTVERLFSVAGRG